ncbi:MAG: hypothetical protein ACI88G_001484 [Woeseiaceae bacterium]
MKKTSKPNNAPTSFSAGFMFAANACLIVYLSTSTIVNSSEPNDMNQFMTDGVLISREDPSLAIDVADEFEFVGRHLFTIRDVAAGERFVFVQAEDHQVQKLLMVQFEGFLPGIDNFYRYDLSGMPVVANYPFRSNGYAFNIVEAIIANPKSESAATYPFLESKGYSVPEELMMWRSLTVADEARSKEMIIFYLEDVKSAGLTLADLYVDDSETDVWINIQRDLEFRANDAFRITELDDSSRPIQSGWSSIPNQFMK